MEEEEEEEEHFTVPSASEDRPQTAVRYSPQSRKVSEGFGIDDLDDLSPDKNDFEDSILANAQAHELNNRIPSLDPTSLPSLPPPSDSSLLYNSDGRNESDAQMDVVDEEAMQRHLNNVESSFMPIASPIGMNGKKGVDDSYLFEGAQPAARNLHTVNEVVTPSKDHAASIQLPPSSPPTPAGAYQTPAAPRAESVEESSLDEGNNTSSLETMSSSPTAAAAARTVFRAISMATNDQEDSSFEHSPEDTDNYVDIMATPRKQNNDSSSSDGRSTVRHVSSNQSLRTTATDAGSTPGAALLNRKPSARRNKYLRGRHSHTSSVSSFVTTPDEGNDVVHGADYALQSGGAVPAEGFSRHSSMALSRSISLGSMASGIEDLSGSTEPSGSLATLAEEEQNSYRRPKDSSTPATPRAPSSRSLAAPSDTIIARHVRNVQVPESVAQEYRNKNGVSPRRSVFGGSTLGRNGKNLTLKEQSSTIERLSKENFDLKLKVMFLSDRLDKLSEEGVKEMISENVELKTGLAVMQRDNKALKRKVKELEKQLKDDEDRPSTARSGNSDQTSPQWFDQEGAQEREEELLYLRERVEEYVTEIEKMRNESMTRENEKRNLAEVVRQMGERRGQNVEVREEMDVWKDLLEQETARREQADDENKRLREEIYRMRTDTTTTSNSGAPGLTHTTNIYNITKKRQVSPSRPRSEVSDRYEDRNGNMSAASTLVEEVRKECEQLRHENAELRREVGAQTSMLTSRNREKERLYQEIEDLKLGQRRSGGSIAGDSIFERSASRANNDRSVSRASVDTRQTQLAENEREELEDKHAELRDRISSLKIKNQDLQRELDSCTADFEEAVELKKEAEACAHELQESLEVAENDLVTMQSERDEALQGQEDVEKEFESLRQEAQTTIDEMQADLDEATSEIERLQTELSDTTENFNALQHEMREMSQSLVRLEDDHETKARKIQDLEQELEEVNKELEQMETDLVQANEKINRLSVQQENLQGELGFMREDQEGDKLKIGELESGKRSAEQTIQNLQGQVDDLEQRLADERRQSEMITDNREREVQHYVNNLNRENAAAKDEIRQLLQKLKSSQGDGAATQRALDSLRDQMKTAISKIHGTEKNFFQDLDQLNRNYEETCRELDRSKASLTEKERIIKQRDSLLESSSLESRKLADMLDKERQVHRNTKHQFETFQKTQQHTTRTLTQQESRVLELETARAMDRRKIATLENNLKDQMNERNQLLLSIWNRLSSLCGSDWAHNNSLINGRALPSLEAVSTMLPGFAKNLMAAVKTIETLVGDFRSRVKAVEKDLWKEYQTLETNLEVRTKRLDRLETMIRSGIPGVTGDNSRELNRLKEVHRGLKAEISSLRAANDVRAGIYQETSPSPSIPTGPRNKSREKISRTSTMTRHQSASAVETFDRAVMSRSGSISSADKLRALSPDMSEGGSSFKPDLRWQIRLQELEYKLKAEREARLVDRSSARQRLEEKNRENAELAAQVERNRVREEMGRG